MTYDNADAEFSGETPAPRPAGERAAEEIVQGLCNCQGAEQAGHRDGCLTRRVAAALTATHEAAVSPVAPMVCRVCGAPATMVVLNDYCDAHDPDEAHEAARREELHDDDCSLGKHGHPYEAVCDCGRDRGEGLCRGCHGNGTITIRESGSSRAIGVSVCPACNGRGEIADPPLTPTGKLARALTEERRLRVQLSDDSQRHLDRALAAERALALAREALGVTVAYLEPLHRRLYEHSGFMNATMLGDRDYGRTVIQQARALLAPESKP
jgi:hypothetical protein